MAAKDTATKKKKLRKYVNNGSVVLNLTLPEDYFSNLAKIRRAKGFRTEQDVIRFSLKDFFNKNGY